MEQKVAITLDIPIYKNAATKQILRKVLLMNQQEKKVFIKRYSSSSNLFCITQYGHKYTLYLNVRAWYNNLTTTSVQAWASGIRMYETFIPSLW